VSKQPELLFTCPRCGKQGFTRRGLAGHYCDGGKRAVLLANPFDEYVPHGGKTRLTPDEIAKALESPLPTQGVLL
jgi:hypothetical protein